jgi:hypothetical protein
MPLTDPLDLQLFAINGMNTGDFALLTVYY